LPGKKYEEGKTAAQGHTITEQNKTCLISGSQNKQRLAAD